MFDSDISVDYQRLHSVMLPQSSMLPESEIVHLRQRFREDFIGRHSFSDYGRLLTMVFVDERDIREMDRELARILYVG